MQGYEWRVIFPLEFTELLDEFERRAHVLYTSGRYELAGINHGKDAISAISFVRRSLSAVELEDNSAVVDRLRETKQRYELRNEDPEGIGSGMIEDLIRQLTSKKS